MEDDVLANLNGSQIKAVTTTEGYVRLIASAGSGKTRALARRFAYLVLELGIAPEHILCVTFTNKAANEMRRRIHMLTGDMDSGFVNTFHGFCVSVLQEDCSILGFPKSFLVLDNSDIDAMLSIIYEERHLTMRDKTYGRARDMFEMKKLKEYPAYYEDLVALTLDELKAKYDSATAVDDILFYGYLYQQKKCFGLDYNDLLKLVLYLFSISPETADKWRRRLEYIMIDEFQDIDEIQYELMEALCGHHKNLFIVGDPDQTIYTWRGANIRYLMDFNKVHVPTQTIILDENYRSSQEILDVANDVISKNNERFKKTLFAHAGKTELYPSFYHAESGPAEAAWIADEIEHLHSDLGESFRDICVLYRSHFVTRQLEEELIKRELPYTLYSGVGFFERQEVRDVLAYLRMVLYQDDLSFERTVNRPKRNIGEQRMRFLRNFADAQGLSLFEALRQKLDDPLFKNTRAYEYVALIDGYAQEAHVRTVSELVSALLNESGYEELLRTEGSQDRLDNLAELKQSIYEYETNCGEEASLDRYLSHVAFFSNLDMAKQSDKIKLMTVHAAKGLEFKNVFLMGMSEGIFPSRKTKTQEGMEEERRICFVAMTRAEKRLFISEAEGVTLEGQTRYPSRFVLEIEPTHLQMASQISEQLLGEAKAHIAFMSKKMSAAVDAKKNIRSVGARIEHRVFGKGTILAVNEEQAAYTIQFDVMETARSITFRTRLSDI